MPMRSFEECGWMDIRAQARGGAGKDREVGTGDLWSTQEHP